MLPPREPAAEEACSISWDTYTKDVQGDEPELWAEEEARQEEKARWGCVELEGALQEAGLEGTVAEEEMLDLLRCLLPLPSRTLAAAPSPLFATNRRLPRGGCGRDWQTGAASTEMGRRSVRTAWPPSSMTSPWSAAALSP